MILFRTKPIQTLLVILMAFTIACATTGPGGKKSLVLISSAQEVEIGAGMAKEVESTEKVLDDSMWQSYLAEVGNKIVAVCDRKDITYHFKVIESDQVNAFAAPGGYVYFYTGLLREMKSESEMAAVMAHEISHVVGRHSVKRLQKALGMAVAYELVFGGEGAGKALDAAIGVGMSLVFADYSRDDEREADNFGIQYMVKAGYDPNGATAMFETLARLGGSSGGSVFENLISSHPQTQERIKNARAEIAAMKPLPSNLLVGADRYAKMVARLPAKKN